MLGDERSATPGPPPAYTLAASAQSSSNSSPTSSSKGPSSGRSDAVMQINGRAEASSSAASSLEDSEGYDSEVASSTSRALRFGKLVAEDAGMLSSRSSRASSPGPNGPAVQHYHHHIHYHGASLAPSGGRGSIASSSNWSGVARDGMETDLEKDASSDDEGDDEFSSSATGSNSSAPIDGPIFHYATLARRLGLYTGQRDTKSKGRIKKIRRRDSDREKAWFRTHKQRRRSRSGPIALSTSSQSSEDGDEHLARHPWLRCIWCSCKALLRQPCVPSTPVTLLFALILIASFAFSLTTFIVHVLDTDKEPLPWRSFCQDQRPFPHELADGLPPVDLFVGVFSVDSAYERRHLIRTTYARHTRPADPVTGRPSNNVQLKFIVGRPRTRHARRVALEMELYGDVVVLDVKENMNSGKTYAFFKWAAENATVPVYYSPLGSDDVKGPRQVAVGFKRADYVVKADDDSFLFLSEIERHLRITPREKTYWGYLIRQLFMGGEVYALSSDLVDYVASYTPLEGHVHGAEDKKVARWMRMHPNASSINWVTERCWIYDHPKAGTTYAHGFLFPDEVERIRLEGRKGLTESERQRRGGAEWAQTWSSVTEWRKDYSVPASGLSIEEEIEALIEGGGRWRADQGWKAPLPSIESTALLFDVDDERLQTVDLSLPKRIAKPRIDWSEVNEPLVSYRYNKIANDLLADPEHLVLPTQPNNGTSSSQQLSPYFEGAMPVQYHAQMPVTVGKPSGPRLMPLPTLRYDAESLSIHEQRMLGLPYGGTVAVHFLKRNEWFLETAIALLGRSKTWEGGVEPAAHLSMATAVSKGSLPRTAAVHTNWDGKSPVELLPNYWGGARMFGSAVLRPDGGKDVYISEGRPLQPPPETPKEASSLPTPAVPRRPPQFAYADPKHGPAFAFGTNVEDGAATTSSSALASIETLKTLTDDFESASTLSPR